jgi:hypothetical protein
VPAAAAATVAATAAAAAVPSVRMGNWSKQQACRDRNGRQKLCHRTHRPHS